MVHTALPLINRLHRPRASRLGRWLRGAPARSSEPAAEEALRAAGVGTWEWKIRTGRVRWSENMEAVHGLARGSFDGTFEGFISLVHPDDRPRLQEALERTLETDAEYHVEYREPGSDGRTHWIEAVGRVIRDSDGRPERMVGICTEVTAEKRAELLARLLADAGAAIARSLDFREALGGVAGMLVPEWADWCVIDLLGEDGAIENVLVEHREPEDESLIREMRAHSPPSLEDRRGIGRVLRTGEPEVLTNVPDDLLRELSRTRQHYESLRRLGIRSAAIVPMVAHGRTLGALSLLSGTSPFLFTEEDLPSLEELATHCALAVDNARLHQQTRRQLAERTEAEERLRSIVDHVVDGIITIDDEGLVETFNPAAQRIFGYEPREVIGQNVRMLMPDPDRGRHDRYVADYLATGKARMMGSGREVTGLRKDGSTFPMELAISEFHLDGRKMFTGIVRDITDRKRAEDELRRLNQTLEEGVRRRTAELEEQTNQLRRTTVELSRAEQRERRKLAELLHDDHQQLLVAARMQAERLEDANAPEVPARLVELLDQAIQSSRTLSHELSPQVLYTSGLPAALEWLVPRMRERYGLDVHMDVGADASPANEDARLLLFRLTRELLLNVAKHAETDEAWVTLGRRGNGRVELVVEDRGQGFDPAELDVRAAGSGGFGLCGIRERLRALGGEVEVDSAPSRGARVTLRVPEEPDAVDWRG